MAHQLTAQERGPEVKRARPALVAALGYGSASLTAAGFSLLSIAFPEQLRELGNSPSLRAILVAHPVAFGPALLLGGVLARALGPARSLGIGGMMLAAGSAATAATGNELILVGLRIVQSLGSGIVIPASLAVILQTVTTPQERSASVARWAACQALAAVVGTALAGLATDQLGWRGAYVLFGGLCLAVSVLCLGSRAPRPGVAGGSFAFGTFGAAALSLASLMFSLSQFGTPGLGVVGATVIAGGAVIACLVWDQRYASRQLIPPRVLKIPSYRIGLIGIALIGAAFLGNFFLQTVVLRSRWHLPLLQVALFAMPVNIAMGLGAGFMSRLAARTGPYRVILASSLTVCACFAAIAWLVQMEDFPRIAWTLVSLVLGLAVAGSMPIFNASGMARVPREDDGVAGAVLQLSRQVGGGVGVAIITTAIANLSPETIASAFIWLAGFALASAALAGIAARTAATASRPS